MLLISYLAIQEKSQITKEPSTQAGLFNVLLLLLLLLTLMPLCLRLAL
jgi:hypothetical protein